MIIRSIWALKVAAPNNSENLHEIGLVWYQFEERIEDFDQPLRTTASPAVWIQINRKEQIGVLQSACPDAKFGPATAFNEALVFCRSADQRKEIQIKLETLFESDKIAEDMETLFREESLEDY
jgi:superfamily II DNA/RNA helicase